MPLAAVVLAGRALVTQAVVAVSIVSLALMGWLAARIGGSNPWSSALRVTFWGALAMAITAAVGALFGTTIS